MDRRLVVAYAAVWVMLDAFVLLPGDPDFSSARGFVASAALQAVLVWLLSRVSRTAGVFALAAAVLMPLSLVMTAPPLEPESIVLLLLSLAQTTAPLTISNEGT